MKQEVFLHSQNLIVTWNYFPICLEERRLTLTHSSLPVEQAGHAECNHTTHSVLEIFPPGVSFCPKLLHHLLSLIGQHSLPDFETDFWTWKATDESVFQTPISQQGHILDLGGEKVHCLIYFSCRVGLTQTPLGT